MAIALTLVSLGLFLVVLAFTLHRRREERHWWLTYVQAEADCALHNKEFCRYIRNLEML